jgi:hypothetical protein
MSSKSKPTKKQNPPVSFLEKFDRWILGLVVLLLLVFLTRGKYGFNDDYVSVGQIVQSNMGFDEVLAVSLNSPFGAGRFVAILLTATFAPLLTTIDSLQFLRIIGAIGWALVSMKIYSELRKLNVARNFSMVLSLIPILVPGSQLTLISGTNFFYSWGTLLAIWVSGQIACLRKRSSLNIFRVTIFALIPTMIYQPISAYLLVIPAISWQLQRNNYEKKMNFLWSIFIYIFSLFTNWILVKLLYESPRLEGGLNLSIKLQTFLSDTLPMSISPHLFLFAPEVARKTYPLVILLSLVLYLVNLQRSQIHIYRGVVDTFLEICILTGLIPLTLGWFFLIHEDGANFRKIFWGSSIWIILFMLSLGPKILQFNRVTETLALSLMIAALLIWTIFFRFSTVQLQEKEWESAVCASAQVKLNGESELALEDMLIPSTLDRYTYKDEIAVQSLVFPGPRVFLPWLSNLKAQPRNLIPSAWGIHASPNGSGEGKKWSEKFYSCWLSKR